MITNRVIIWFGSHIWRHFAHSTGIEPVHPHTLCSNKDRNGHTIPVGRYIDRIHHIHHTMCRLAHV